MLLRLSNLTTDGPDKLKKQLFQNKLRQRLISDFSHFQSSSPLAPTLWTSSVLTLTWWDTFSNNYYMLTDPFIQDMTTNSPNDTNSLPASLPVCPHLSARFPHCLPPCCLPLCLPPYLVVCRLVYLPSSLLSLSAHLYLPAYMSPFLPPCLYPCLPTSHPVLPATLSPRSLPRSLPCCLLSCLSHSLSAFISTSLPPSLPASIPVCLPLYLPACMHASWHAVSSQHVNNMTTPAVAVSPSWSVVTQPPTPALPANEGVGAQRSTGTQACNNAPSRLHRRSRKQPNGA